MYVGLLELRFRIHGVRSLKGKRAVVRKIIDRTRAKFPVAVAEVGDNDVPNAARIGVSVLGNDVRHVEGFVDKVLAFIEEMYAADLVDIEREVFLWGHKDEW